MGVGNGMKVFRGCMAFLAPSKSPAATSQTSAAAIFTNKSNENQKTRVRAKAKNPTTSSTADIKPKITKEPTKPYGILKVVQVSPALGTFLGVSEASRTDAVKQIWSYIKLHDLQNPKNKREIICDEKLKNIFDGRETVGFLEIGKLLTRHFIKAD